MKKLRLSLLFTLLLCQFINAQEKIDKDFILDSIQQVYKILSDKNFYINQLKKDMYWNTIYEKKIQLSYFRGKPIAIRFWCLKCKPCDSTIVREKLEGFSSNAVYIYINLKDKKEEIISFLEENKNYFPNTKYLYHVSGEDNPLLLEERKQKNSFFNHNSTPATYWITKNGWFIHSPKYMVGYIEHIDAEDGIIIEKLLRLKKLIF